MHLALNLSRYLPYMWGQEDWRAADMCVVGFGDSESGALLLVRLVARVDQSYASKKHERLTSVFLSVWYFINYW